MKHNSAQLKLFFYCFVLFQFCEIRCSNLGNHLLLTDKELALKAKNTAICMRLLQKTGPGKKIVIAHDVEVLNQVLGEKEKWHVKSN